MIDDRGELTPLPPGAKVREFRIERKLGDGSFGIVYVATHEILEETVAVKEFLPRDLAHRADGTRVEAFPDKTSEYEWAREKFLHEAKTLKTLADHEFHESVDEMKHADELVERILFLEGLPNMQDVGKLRIGENTREMLACDLALEMDAIPDLREAIQHCEACRDFVSRDLFDSILSSEEEHVDWLETQLDLIDRVGVENYQQSQMG